MIVSFFTWFFLLLLSANLIIFLANGHPISVAGADSRWRQMSRRGSASLGDMAGEALKGKKIYTLGLSVGAIRTTKPATASLQRLRACNHTNIPDEKSCWKWQFLRVFSASWSRSQILAFLQLARRRGFEGNLDRIYPHDGSHASDRRSRWARAGFPFRPSRAEPLFRQTGQITACARYGAHDEQSNHITCAPYVGYGSLSGWPNQGAGKASPNRIFR